MCDCLLQVLNCGRLLSGKYSSANSVKCPSINGSTGTRNANIYSRDSSVVKSLKCKVCGLQFESVRARRNHHLKHIKERDSRICMMFTGSKSFLCDYCGSRFISVHNLHGHLRTVHAELLPYRCMACKKTFIASLGLHMHLLRVHCDDKSFECSFCASQFPSVSDLLGHIGSTHVVDHPYKCSSCRKTFVSSFGLHKHTLSKHAGGEISGGDEPLEVGCSRDSFVASVSLNEYVGSNRADSVSSDSIGSHSIQRQSTSSPRPYQCLICNQKFSRFGTFHCHLSVHIGKRAHRLTCTAEQQSRVETVFDSCSADLDFNRLASSESSVISKSSSADKPTEVRRIRNMLVPQKVMSRQTVLMLVGTTEAGRTVEVENAEDSLVAGENAGQHGLNSPADSLSSGLKESLGTRHQPTDANNTYRKSSFCEMKFDRLTALQHLQSIHSGNRFFIDNDIS